MKFAFIDYENLNSLDHLDLAQYDHIFLFIGANQQQIHFSEIVDKELLLTIIRVKEIAKNNLDFHIAYYLGKLDAEVDKAIEFYVLSKDKGYQGICQFIQQNSRTCRLISLEQVVSKPNSNAIKNTPEPTKTHQPTESKTQSLYQKFEAFLLSKPTNKRPQKIKSVRNEINSYLALKNNMQQINQIYQQLIQQGILRESENKAVYLK